MLASKVNCFVLKHSNKLPKCVHPPSQPIYDNISDKNNNSSRRQRYRDVTTFTKLSSLPSSQQQQQGGGRTATTTTDGSKRQQQKQWIDYKELERQIVRLGRRGETDEALNMVWNLDGACPPTVRIWNAAIDACARARPTRLNDAFDVFQRFLYKPHKPNVFTFGSLMSACARARNADKALKLLRSMKSQYNVEPNAIVYSSAISACARNAAETKWEVALELLEECTQSQPMSVVGYNAALSACAQAGQYQAAISLLEQMKNDHDSTTTAIPQPDAISYGTVLMACERGEAWEVLLEQAKGMEDNQIPMDTLSLTSCLHACQQLGRAEEALRYLSLCKSATGVGQPKRQTAGWERKGVRKPLKGADPVAYRLAISACARGNQYQAGLDLLDEMHDVGLEIDVMACTAAVTGCEYVGEWRQAFVVLQKMIKAGIQPNEVTLAAVIAACGTACANTKDFEERDLAKRKALQLYQMMKKQKRPKSSTNGRPYPFVKPNTAVYSSLIRTCAEAQDMEMAFRIMTDLQEDPDHDPNVITYSSLMTACERVGSLEGVTRVFTMIRDEDKNGIQANEVVYGAGISTCRKNEEPDRCLLLLRRMLKEGLQPNTATFNAVLGAQRVERTKKSMTKTRKKHRAKEMAKNLVTIYKLLSSNETDATPDRETFCVLIWNMNNAQHPQGGEYFIRQMVAAGFTPDVDMYTKTVASYERIGQPIKAIRVMEYMESQGINFYNVPILNAAFSKALKLVNTVVGRGGDDADSSLSSSENDYNKNNENGNDDDHNELELEFDKL